MQKQTNWWAACLVLGIGVIMISQWLGTMFPTEGAGYAVGYGVPVIAFEMARSVADLQAVFGQVGDEARAARISGMDLGNRWDFLFMGVYGLFITTFFLAAHRVRGNKLWLGFSLFGLLAALFDAYENSILLGLTQDLEAAKDLDLLIYPVWGKFLSIMIGGMGVGLYLLGQAGFGWKIVGAVVTLIAASTVLSLLQPAQYGVLIALSAGVPWLVQLIFVGVRTVRGDLSQSVA